MAEHEWLYGGISDSTICMKCFLRRDAPELRTNSQAFAPCKGIQTMTDKPTPSQETEIQAISGFISSPPAMMDEAVELAKNIADIEFRYCKAEHVGKLGIWRREDADECQNILSHKAITAAREAGRREGLELLTAIDRKAQAGLCQLTVAGKHEFLKDIRALINRT